VKRTNPPSAEGLALAWAFRITTTCLRQLKRFFKRIATFPDISKMSPDMVRRLETQLLIRCARRVKPRKKGEEKLEAGALALRVSQEGTSPGPTSSSIFNDLVRNASKAMDSGTITSR
jgi:hypothetical protein